MGHLTRLTAYLRRMPPTVRPYVLSLSQAVPVLEQFGVPWEYLPSAGATGQTNPIWRDLFTDRLCEAFERLQPQVVVFDGTYPYPGIDVALRAFPHVRSVWSRRGMWKRGHSSDNLRKATWFDVVVEPGDLAAGADRGPTPRADAVRVGPVTLLDSSELTPRADARAALGLPSDGACALVSLGAGNINDTATQVGAAAAALRARGFDVCMTQSAITTTELIADGVRPVSAFPLSRHLRAFDVAVSAAGYNSFHELLRFGIPTVFIPNDQTALDDQVGRAAWAHSHDWARTIDPSVGSVSRTMLLGQFLDEVLADADAARARVAGADPGNGASRAAEVIVAAAADVSGSPLVNPTHAGPA